MQNIFKILDKFKYKKPTNFYNGKWYIQGGQTIEVKNMSGRQARDAVKHAEKIIWNKRAEINVLEKQKTKMLEEFVMERCKNEI